MKRETARIRPGAVEELTTTAAERAVGPIVAARRGPRTTQTHPHGSPTKNTQCGDEIQSPCPVLLITRPIRPGRIGEPHIQREKRSGQVRCGPEFGRGGRDCVRRGPCCGRLTRQSPLATAPFAAACAALSIGVFFFSLVVVIGPWRMIPTRVYIGGLPLDVRERDIEDLFYKVSVRRH